jgi:CubicO group peptidase (beta-lactamase class C family)
MCRWKILATTALAAMLVAATAVLPVSARELQPLATATPEQVGMSVERLGRITTMLKKEITDGKLPGAVVMVARKGKLVYSNAIGFQDKGAETPMKLDLIFRIYSMTKPLVSVAAMMLVEDGVIQLTDPVSKFLPAFKDMQVSVAQAPMARPPTRMYRRPSRSPCRTFCGIARVLPMPRSPRTNR